MAKTSKEKNGGSAILVEIGRLFADYAKHWGVLLVTVALVVLGSSIRGDVIIVAILVYRSYLTNFHQRLSVDAQNLTDYGANHTFTVSRGSDGEPPYVYEPLLPAHLQILPDEWNMKDFLFYVVVGVTSSQLIFQAFSGFLQWYYYIRQRNNPQDWKCQPERFLTRSNELHEFVVGTINMTLAGTTSGFLVCWVMNGNYNTIYFTIDKYGYPYFFFSFIIMFFWLEGTSYYYHIILHIPFMYRTVHKQHHRYHSPTAYSTIAMSPFEVIGFDFCLFTPLFLFPINAIPFIAILLYANYHGIVGHSGIKMESWCPWQPHSLFHDDHHKYFHVNFGFNTYLFDWLHGTIRRKDRIYGEDIFGGRGKEKET